eukprot:TRINITY_DN11271_c0_g1_i1.p1 TRINITY_DN11271_c0_g1~~TRINITY_DN11271_c0_g1_i1.p1  ORF type:complete len:394 (-),score=73.80 TRINITY_DN11271_c0_g1_i1:364-1545(-)
MSLSSFTCTYQCFLSLFFFLMIRRPPRSTLSSSSAASDVYKRQMGWQATMRDPVELQHRIASCLEAVVLPLVLLGQLAWLVLWPLTVNSLYPHGVYLFSEYKRLRHYQFVLQGGALFATMYLLGWALILGSVGSFVSGPWSNNLVHMSGCALGQVFMCCSFLIYDTQHAGKPHSHTPVFGAFCAMTVTLAVLGSAFNTLAGLIILSEADTPPGFPQIEQLLGIGSFMIVWAVFLTYGLGGSWRNSAAGWSFYQPFSGGKRFIAAQIISWTCMSVSILIALGTLLCYLGVTAMAPFAYCQSTPTGTGWGVMLAGISGVLSQLTMLFSIIVYENAEEPQAKQGPEQSTILGFSSPKAMVFFSLVLTVSLAAGAFALCYPIKLGGMCAMIPVNRVP